MQVEWPLRVEGRLPKSRSRCELMGACRVPVTIKSAGAAFPEVAPADRASWLPAVLKVLYLVFNEGYTASGGDDLVRVDLSSEAIRVARLLAELLPGEPEMGGLLAL